jgi:cell division protein ZipA
LAELRWILLGLGIIAIGAIWWWSARRSGQAPGNAELRESTSAPPHGFGASSADSASTSSEKRHPAAGTRDWSVSPLEPLSIRTADFERVPALDEPMMTGAGPLELSAEEPVVETPPLESAPPMRATSPVQPVSALAQVSPVPPMSPVPPASASAPAPQAPNAAELQKIVSVRVCSVGDTRWAGTTLMAALEVHGLAHGRYQVYHRNHSDGRSIFCVASLVEPGTFDLSRMPDEEFRGVVFFAVLPGPLEPLQTVDALLATARELARELSGTMQDAKGVPLSPQRAAALREDVARFQALLP